MRNVVFIDLGRSENEDVINQKCVFFYARVFSAYQAFCSLLVFVIFSVTGDFPYVRAGIIYWKQLV